MSASTSAVPRWAGPRRTAGSPRQRAANGLTVASWPVRALKGVLLTICCLAVVGPFVAVIATSLADSKQVNSAGGLVLWPTHPSLNSYR
ncbi:MAG TPA: hypothetical protein VHX39_23140, partial [Acetobacteraceae bacterium]|nr:hypothetical protein [Acetobacteraceae bacterium]